MPATYFPAIIDRSASCYGVTFPDFPGCIAAGQSINEACQQAEKALAFHLEAMVKDGDEIPEPSELPLASEWSAGDIVGIMVRADYTPKVVRVLISLDENLLRQVDGATNNRSAFMAEAARRALAAIGPAPIYARIEDAIRDRPGMSQAEIAKALFGNEGYQQRVNQDCAWLVGQGRIVRAKGRPARYYVPEAIPEGVEAEAA